jgi:hypothetical protein
MRNLLLLSLLSLFFCMMSCGSLISAPNLVQQTPDIINRPTTTVLPKQSNAELAKGTWLKTDSENTIEVNLEENTPVVVKDPKDPSLESQYVLPKNTKVTLPENTYIQTLNPSTVQIEASTEVVLPPGTEIKITRVNWYAILFYILLTGGVAWYYIQGRNEDKDQDGFVDEKKTNSKT